MGHGRKEKGGEGEEKEEKEREHLVLPSLFSTAGAANTTLKKQGNNGVGQIV